MHLRDILKAIGLIEQFIDSMDFQAYFADLKTQAAVERQLQIVTEAAYRLKPEDEHLCPGPNWRKVRGMGNVLRHDYDRLSDETIWNTVQNESSSTQTSRHPSAGDPLPANS